MNTVIRPRQLFVTGGSRLSTNAALLWRELGRLLGAEDSLVVLTGGLQQLVKHDVVEAIRDGVNHCYFAIADTTDDRPNVMYELGLAHALSKPVILLRRMNPDGSLPAPPFDFQTQSILGYDHDLDDLRRRLETAIGVLTGRIGSPLTS